MTAALVGLIGVIAGALLGGVVNYVIERRKRWAAADAAGRLIAGELAATELRLQASSERKHWWAGDLPTEAWRTHAKDLGAELPGVLQDLSTVYVNVIDSWNAERAAADADRELLGAQRPELPHWLVAIADAVGGRKVADPHAERTELPEPSDGAAHEVDAERLRRDVATIRTVRRRLETALTRPPGKWHRAIGKTAAIAAAIALAVVLAIVAFVRGCPVARRT